MLRWGMYICWKILYRSSSWKLFIQLSYNCLSQGLSHLHNSLLLYHGNLTSDTCMVDKRWVLNITDYGLLDLRRQHTGDDVGEYQKYKGKRKALYINGLTRFDRNSIYNVCIHYYSVLQGPASMTWWPLCIMSCSYPYSLYIYTHLHKQISLISDQKTTFILTKLKLINTHIGIKLSFFWVSQCFYIMNLCVVIL